MEPRSRFAGEYPPWIITPAGSYCQPRCKGGARGRHLSFQIPSPSRAICPVGWSLIYEFETSAGIDVCRHWHFSLACDKWLSLHRDSERYGRAAHCRSRSCPAPLLLPGERHSPRGSAKPHVSELETAGWWVSLPQILLPDASCIQSVRIDQIPACCCATSGRMIRAGLSFLCRVGNLVRIDTNEERVGVGGGVERARDGIGRR